MIGNGAAVARDVRGMLAVAATYVYFLLFAQYGFLRLLASRGAGPAELAPVLAAMGLAGLTVSLAAARLLVGSTSTRLLRAGFTGAALAALLALAAESPGVMLAIAVLIGSSTALVTVSLAADLGALLGRPAFALKVGAATGAAYLFCNVPAVFAGSPASQCALSALVAVLGLAAVPASVGSPPRAPEVPASDARDYRGLGFLAVVLSFLALIALDSAAFSIIQQSPELKALSWQDGGRGWLLGVTHLAAAVAAGWLLDRGFFRSLLLSTFALFVVGLGALGGQATRFVTGAPLYVAGVSLYSVALVVYPSRLGDLPGLVPRRWRAALLFGVAGWLGSAAGIGVSQGLQHVPTSLLAASGALLGAAVALTARRELIGRFVRAHRITAACGAFALGLYLAGPGLNPKPAGERLEAQVRHGQEVYVAEGCIHCHSQYVRPETRDVEWWGPYDDALHPADRPVLIGNRRQGPDLLNVGLRRSARWEELHLRSPRAVSPGSCMPSYAHLFAKGDDRGDDLVAYLTTLGASRARERAAYIETWDASTPARSSERGARLYERLCTPCHGTSARGDGPLAREIARPGMNLLKDDFWLISWGPGAEPEAEALARLVKFGASGSTMPGHETLSAEEVADVVAHVRALRAAHLAHAAARGPGGPDPGRGG